MRKDINGKTVNPCRCDVLLQREQYAWQRNRPFLRICPPLIYPVPVLGKEQED